eukprot:1143845-Pelagomonas_calceolata.AAC.4
MSPSSSPTLPPTHAVVSGRKTLESVSAADALVDALEMAAHEEERHRDHQKQLAAGGPSRCSWLGAGITRSSWLYVGEAAEEVGLLDVCKQHRGHQKKLVAGG